VIKFLFLNSFYLKLDFNIIEISIDIDFSTILNIIAFGFYYYLFQHQI